MLLVSEQAGACPVARRASLGDRAAVRLRNLSLDRELASGTSPEASVRLALRAQRLVSMRVRRELARSVRRILAASQPAGAMRTRVPYCAPRVREAAAEFAMLTERLLCPGPVPAKGVAQVSVLLRDGRGALYRWSCQDDLRARVSEAAEALDPLAAW